MTGVGTAGGAGTIVNAFATGKGAAFGLRQRVTARVTSARTYSVWNGSRRLTPAEARLAIEAARAVQRRVVDREPLRIDVRSPIPPKIGLKSSSAVSVAVGRAVLDRVDSSLDARELLSLLADAGLKSRTSLTGAYDDLAACLHGGVVFTDNLKRQLVRVDALPSGLIALVHAPTEGARSTGSLRRKDFLPLADLVEEAWRLALKGNYKDAMLVNTLAYAPVLRVHPTFTLRAIERGAYAAGLSGKGPAEVALVHPELLHRFRDLGPRVRTVELHAGGGP
jgi:shikimate kinase